MSALKLTRKISIAPMMGYTDRHFRYLLRLMSERFWLYTEMITCNQLQSRLHQTQKI